MAYAFNQRSAHCVAKQQYSNRKKQKVTGLLWITAAESTAQQLHVQMPVQHVNHVCYTVFILYLMTILVGISVVCRCN